MVRCFVCVCVAFGWVGVRLLFGVLNLQGFWRTSFSISDCDCCGTCLVLFYGLLFLWF